MNQPKAFERQYRAVIRNERLTALAGAVLLVGFIIDLYATTDLNKLIMVHIFIGALLAGPLIVKLSSVGYRFFSYYGKSPAFIAKGPPNVWLRLLAPFLILVTLTLFLSGVALALEGGPTNRLIFLIHAGSAAIWIPLIVVHVYAHIHQVPRAVASHWDSSSPDALSGRIKRLRITILSLIIGALGGLLLTRLASPWKHIHFPSGIQSPVILGIGAAVIAMFIAVPLLRGARE